MEEKLHIVETCRRLGVDLEQLAAQLRKKNSAYFSRVDGGAGNISPLAVKTIATAISNLSDSSVQKVLKSITTGEFEPIREDVEQPINKFLGFLESGPSDYSKSDNAYRVESNLVGEDFWCIPLKKDIERFRAKKNLSDSTVIFTSHELQRLQRVSPEGAKKAHLLKKMLNGTVTSVVQFEDYF